MDALQEFNATRNIVPAEFGRTTGGVVNMTSKSGTNRFHGSADYNFRNADLTTLDAFARESVGRNQQLAGTLGGPISKDRMFFFLGPQMQVAHKPVAIDYAVLTPELRSTPAAQALLAAAPEGVSTAQSNSQSILSRFDHNFSKGSSFFARFDFTHVSSTTLTGSSNNGSGPSLTSSTVSALSNQTLVDIWSGTLMGQLTSALSSNRLNELRLQLGREVRPRSAQGSGPQVTVQQGGATVAVYGPQATGVSFGNGAFPSADNRHEVADNFSIISGAHSAKFGVDLLHISTNMTYSPGQNGHYIFTSLASFLARQPFSYQQFTGSGALRTSVNELGFFAQDEWRVLPYLTISPGLRYDAELTPDYLRATSPQDRTPGATKIPDQLKQFQPRLGIAWNVFPSGKTVVRAGGGLYYATTQMPEFAQALLFNGGNPELGLGYAVASTNPTQVANAFAAAGVHLAQAPLDNLPVLTTQQYQASIQSPSVGLSAYYMDPRFKNARALQWKVGVDEVLAQGIVLGVDFTYVNAVNIARKLDLNLPLPVPDATGRLIYSGTRPLAPHYQFDVVSEASGRSLYRAMVTSLNVQRRHFVINANYTLGYNLSLADNERPVGALSTESYANMKNDYGWSQLDMRHGFTTTGIIYLPFGMDISTATRFSSGRPFSATVGQDLNRDGNNNDRPLLNGSVIKRNSYRNQAFHSVDLRVDRHFNLPNERGSIIVSADFFNLFNSPNMLLAGPSVTYGNAGSVVQNGALVQLGPQNPAAFQQLRDSLGHYIRSNSPGDPFQVQLGLRFEF